MDYSLLFLCAVDVILAPAATIIFFLFFMEFSSLLGCLWLFKYSVTMSLIMFELFSFGNFSDTYLFIGKIPVALNEVCKSFDIEPPPLKLSINSSILCKKVENYDLEINLVFWFFHSFNEFGHSCFNGQKTPTS